MCGIFTKGCFLDHSLWGRKERNSEEMGGVKLVDSTAKSPVSQHRSHRSSDDLAEVPLDVGPLASLTRKGAWL